MKMLTSIPSLEHTIIFTMCSFLEERPARSFVSPQEIQINAIYLLTTALWNNTRTSPKQHHCSAVLASMFKVPNCSPFSISSFATCRYHTIRCKLYFSDVLLWDWNFLACNFFTLLILWSTWFPNCDSFCQSVWSHFSNTLSQFNIKTYNLHCLLFLRAPTKLSRLDTLSDTNSEVSDLMRNQCLYPTCVCPSLIWDDMSLTNTRLCDDLSSLMLTTWSVPSLQQSAKLHVFLSWTVWSSSRSNIWAWSRVNDWQVWSSPISLVLHT